MPSKRIANVVVIVVTAMWALNLAAGLWVAGYDPDPTVHVVMMSIVGGLLALGAREDSKKGNGGDPT